MAGCCQRARAAGVRGGMSLSHARSFLPTGRVLIRPVTPQQDAEALCALARWANRFSPVVAVDPPDGLLMDVLGCGRLFRGERRLMNQMTDAVERLGFEQARASVAPTFGCAWAEARFGKQPRRIISDKDTQRVLEPLPIAALRVEDRIVESLSEVGIDRIGYLFDIPRKQLAARFGDELLIRLDQATGRAIEMIDPVRPREALRAQIDFDGPTTRFDAIEAASRQLVDQLTVKLKHREEGARRLDLILDRIDTQPEQVTVVLSRPSRAAKHLWSLLRPRLERVNLGFGVQCVRLVATRTGILKHEQTRCTATDDHLDPAALAGECGQLLDTLVNRLGPDAVTQVQRVATHLPEQAFRRRRADLSKQPSHTTPQIDPAFDNDRPTVVFDPAQPVVVMAVTPEGPPSWMCWNGMELRLVDAYGPERIEREWWRERPSSKRDNASPVQGRDYFKAQDEQGRWLWIYRDLELNRWFVHGQWA